MWGKPLSRKSFLHLSIHPVHRAPLNVNNISTFITTLLCLPTPTCSLLSRRRRRRVFYFIKLWMLLKQALPSRLDAGRDEERMLMILVKKKSERFWCCTWAEELSPTRFQHAAWQCPAGVPRCDINKPIWGIYWNLEWVSSVTAAQTCFRFCSWLPYAL